MLLCVLGPGELAHIRASDGPITMPCTTLMQLVHGHLAYFSFPSTFTLYFCPVTQVLPVPLPLGHKRRGKVQQETGVENKDSAQEEEEIDAVILSGKPGRRSS